MRNLKVAYGNSRNAKKWSNKTICYDDLNNRNDGRVCKNE